MYVCQGDRGESVCMCVRVRGERECVYECQGERGRECVCAYVVSCVQTEVCTEVPRHGNRQQESRATERDSTEI